jgi:hypothetical protein
MMRMRTASNYNKCISHAAAGHRDGPMTLVEFIHQIRMVAIYFDKIILGGGCCKHSLPASNVEVCRCLGSGSQLGGPVYCGNAGLHKTSATPEPGERPVMMNSSFVRIDTVSCVCLRNVGTTVSLTVCVCTMSPLAARSSNAKFDR